MQTREDHGLSLEKMLFYTKMAILEFLRALNQNFWDVKTSSRTIPFQFAQIKTYILTE
jgi:hypothetical protein